MPAAVAITPASGSITAKTTVCKVAVTGASANILASYTTSVYPTSPQSQFYLLFDAPAGTDDGRSYVFNVASDGTHLFNNYIFPAAGSWTIRLRKASDDSDVATASVTVS